MELFELKDYSLTFAPQALALKPFKDLFDADKSKDKHKAIMELSYVYFFADGRSDFIDILNLEDRTQEIRISLSLPKEWKPSPLVEAAIKFYQEREDTVANRLLQAGIQGAEKIATFINNIDLNERDEKNKMVHNTKQIQATIVRVGSLNSLKQRIKEV